MNTVYRIFIKLGVTVVHTEDVAPADVEKKLRELEAKYPGHTVKMSIRDTLGN